jgi:hypothetical protein
MTAQNKGSNDGLAVKPNPSEPKKKDIRFALAMFIACVFGGLFVTGWVKVLVGLGVAPLETIAAQIGVALVPFVVGWLIAKVIGLALKKVSFNTLWVASTTLLIVLMFVGQNKSEPSMATGDSTKIQSIEKPNTAISDDVGMCINAFNNMQWDTASSVCSQAAHKGSSEAQMRLAALYETGLGVTKDTREAVRLFTLAANKGLAEAQFQLGRAYKNGEGVAQDYEKALYWYTQAAEQGDASAQFALGWIYDDGLGVKRDFVRAHMWYNLAGANNESLGTENRDLIASQMTREQIAEAQQMARDCSAKNFKNCN